MSDHDMTETRPNGGGVGWFAAGALAIAAAIALFLYADGFFDQADASEVVVEMPAVYIEGS